MDLIKFKSSSRESSGNGIIINIIMIIYMRILYRNISHHIFILDFAPLLFGIVYVPG